MRQQTMGTTSFSEKIIHFARWYLLLVAAVAAVGLLLPMAVRATMCCEAGKEGSYTDTVDCINSGCTDCQEISGQCPTAAPSSDKSGSASSAFKKRYLSNPLSANTIPDIIGKVIKIFTGLVGSLALLMFVYGGFLMMISGGDSSKVEKGKTVMKQATLGLIIIFTAYALVYMIFSALGVQGI